jgi:ATP-binding cassette subfamily B multidrug efflux pump
LTQSTGKRLYEYGLMYKKMIIAGLLMLTVAVGLELVGPFIAKHMIDKHILGIERPWHEVEEGYDGAVPFQGKWYKRQDYFSAGETKGQEVRVLQVERAYYFVGEPVRFDDGRRKIENGLLNATKDGVTETYAAQRLSREQVFAFYRPGVGDVIMLAIIYFALIAVSALFHYGQKYVLQVSANRIIQRIRRDVYGQIHRLPINYFDNLPAGKVVSRVTNDTEAIMELFVKVLATFFTSSIYIVGIYIALFLLDMRLALVCAIFLPILYMWTVLYRRLASKYNRVIRSRLSDINGMINESIQGMTIIQAFRREKQTSREFEVFNGEHFTFQNKLLNLNALTSHNLVQVFRNIAFVWLIWHFGGSTLGVGSALSVGVLYAFVDYLNRLFHPVLNLVNSLPQLEQARVAAERVFELMNEKGTDVADGSMPRYKGDVKFDRVWFAYKDGDDVLKDISFEARRGQTVALVGHTGSGKSSIMNLLFRFYDADRGRITIDGKDVKEIPHQIVREHMGIVLQDPCLFTGTIASNVSLDDPRISREQVEKALREVGGDQLFKHLPRGYDEPVLEKGSTLSLGQRQLISFARALAFDPAILILDEATASIDTETEAVIQDAMQVLKKGRTTLVIAHRLSTIKNADLILVLDRGQIVERGTHDELMAVRGRYYQMYQLQQGAKGNVAV